MLSFETRFQILRVVNTTAAPLVDKKQPCGFFKDHYVISTGYPNSTYLVMISLISAPPSPLPPASSSSPKELCPPNYNGSTFTPIGMFEASERREGLSFSTYSTQIYTYPKPANT